MSDLPSSGPVVPAIESVPEAKTPSVTGEVEIPVPYTDYEGQHAHSYLVDYYQLGDTWNDPVGGFPLEIEAIDEYMRSKIDSGVLANSPSAIKKELQRLEKLTNVKDDERPLVKIETVAAYIDFLAKTDKIHFNLRHYG